MNPAEQGRHVEQFFSAIGRREVEIYNEFSLQHEFGVWLRARIGDPGVKLQFERPASHFGIAARLIKKEIDLACFRTIEDTLFAVELKFPRNGQVPIQMFKFCQDVAFLEELVLKERRFPFGCALIAADDPDFYRGTRHPAGSTYAIFRDGAPMRGTIAKTTGPAEPPVSLTGTYSIDWNPVPGSPALRYAMVIVDGGRSAS